MSKKKHVVVDSSTGEQRQGPKAWTQLEVPWREKDHEKNDQVSKTKPGMTMTIKEMIERHRKGLPIDQTKSGKQMFVEGDEPLQNMDHMDLVDKQNYIDSVADALVEVRTRLEESAKTNKEVQFLKKVDEEVKKRLARIQIKDNPPEDAEIVE